jgi:hypothetical protein
LPALPFRRHRGRRRAFRGLRPCRRLVPQRLVTATGRTRSPVTYGSLPGPRDWPLRESARMWHVLSG